MSMNGLGGTVVVMEHFDAEQYLALDRALPRHPQPGRADDVRAPAQARPTRCAARYDVSSLQCVIHAAAPCPVPVKQQMIEWFGPVIHEYYAGTEGNGFVYCNTEQWLAHPGTVGAPIGCTLHIVGEDGEEVPPGESGHDLLRGRGQLRVPQRRREDEGRHATRRAGARSATSATSTTTASCSSPTARRT